MKFQTLVKKAIDDMVSQLLKEKEDEIKHKDFCVDEFRAADSANLYRTFDHSGHIK